jgi:replicative DNA helicase
MNSNELNTPIHNLEAEEAVIGAVLIDSESFFDVAQYINANDFHIVKHQWIWKAFETLHDNGTPIDLLTVQQELEKHDHLKDIGGAAYITKLITMTPTAYNAAAYAKLVDEAATRRRMIRAATEIAKLAYELDADIESVTASAMGALSHIVTVRGGAVPIEKYLSKLYDTVMDKYNNPKRVNGFNTGFVDLDDLLGGLMKKRVYMITGEPGQGKTVLVVQAALHMAKQASGVIYELEMDGESLAQRMVAAEYLLDTRLMESGRLSEAQLGEFINAVSEISMRRLLMSDLSSTNTMGLRADLMRLKQQDRVQWVVVDYLNLLSDRYGKDEIEREAFISRQLHSIAKDLDLCLIVVQGMNKSGKMAGPKSIEHDADVIMELGEHDTDVGEPQENIRTLKIHKTRFSKSGRIELMMMDGPRLVNMETHSLSFDEPAPKKNGKKKYSRELLETAP